MASAPRSERKLPSLRTPRGAAAMQWQTGVPARSPTQRDESNDEMASSAAFFRVGWGAGARPFEPQEASCNDDEPWRAEKCVSVRSQHMV